MKVNLSKRERQLLSSIMSPAITCLDDLLDYPNESSQDEYVKLAAERKEMDDLFRKINGK